MEQIGGRELEAMPSARQGFESTFDVFGRCIINILKSRGFIVPWGEV